MTTQPTGAAELPEALKHAEGLESFAGQLPAYGFNPQPLKDAATHLRRQHALLNEQQRTIEALNACINGEGSTTTDNLRLVDRLHAAHQHAQGNVALLADILNRRPAMNAVLAEAYGAWTAEVYDLMGTMAAAPANDAQVEALRAQPAGALHVQKQPEIEHVDGDASKNGRQSNMTGQPAGAATPAATPWQRALEIRMAQGWRLKGDRLPVLYTDSINGDQVGRDDLWLCTTAALTPAAPAHAARDAVGNVYRLTEPEWQGLDAAMTALTKIAERKQMELGIDGDNVRAQTIADAARSAKYALGLFNPAYASLTTVATPKPAATEAAVDALRTAAQDVVDRWDTPLWKDAPATAEYIGMLRAALAAQQGGAA